VYRKRFPESLLSMDEFHAVQQRLQALAPSSFKNLVTEYWEGATSCLTLYRSGLGLLEAQLLCDVMCVARVVPPPPVVCDCGRRWTQAGLSCRVAVE
jgi:hypothetical protein